MQLSSSKLPQDRTAFLSSAQTVVPSAHSSLQVSPQSPLEQLSPSGHEPHVALQPSSPHCFPAQSGAHSQLPSLQISLLPQVLTIWSSVQPLPSPSPQNMTFLPSHVSGIDGSHRLSQLSATHRLSLHAKPSVQEPQDSPHPSSPHVLPSQVHSPGIVTHASSVSPAALVTLLHSLPSGQESSQLCAQISPSAFLIHRPDWQSSFSVQDCPNWPEVSCELSVEGFCASSAEPLSLFDA